MSAWSARECRSPRAWSRLVRPTGPSFQETGGGHRGHCPGAGALRGIGRGFVTAGVVTGVWIVAVVTRPRCGAWRAASAWPRAVWAWRSAVAGWRPAAAVNAPATAMSAWSWGSSLARRSSSPARAAWAAGLSPRSATSHARKQTRCSTSARPPGVGGLVQLGSAVSQSRFISSAWARPATATARASRSPAWRRWAAARTASAPAAGSVAVMASDRLSSAAQRDGVVGLGRLRPPPSRVAEPLPAGGGNELLARLGVPPPPAQRLPGDGRGAAGPCLRGIAWRRENGSPPSGAELACTFCSVGINL
jgi:hypothetical protein